MSRRNLFYHTLLIFVIYLTTVAPISQNATIPDTEAAPMDCYCDQIDAYCIDNTCQTTTKGYCFAHIVESFDDREKTYSDVYTYGCLAPGEGSLMQCKSQKTPHLEPQNITCCQSDNCNIDIVPNYIRRPDQMRPIDHLKENLPYVFLGLFIIIGFIVLICMIRFIKKRKDIIFMLFERKHKMNDKDCTSISDDINKEKLTICDDGSISYDELTSGLGTRSLMPITIGKQIILDENGEIGRGRFGRVVKGNMCGTPVAVKIFSSVDEESWKRERYIYDQCIKNHENILGYYAADLISSLNGDVEFWLITHYCKHRSLYEFLNDPDEIIAEAQALSIIHSIINGLDYLHRQSSGCEFFKPSIAHRDIKSKNILMKSKSVCCIADFGHAVINMADGTIYRGHPHDLRVGTKRYMAPEVLVQSMDPNKFSSYAMSDVYQFALVMWEICNRIGYNAPEYSLPYGDVVPTDPSFEDMVKVVYIDQYRPPLRQPTNMVTTTLNQIVEESWRPTPVARCATLRIKKKLQELQETSNSPRLNHKYTDDYGSSGYYGDDGVAL